MPCILSPLSLLVQWQRKQLAQPANGLSSTTARQSCRQQDEDIFSIVGGCELGADSRHHPLQQARNNVSTNSLGSAAGLPNSSSVGNLSCLGDLPEEQPSRILFIRGLDATVSDEALVQMFEVCIPALWPYCYSCYHVQSCFYFAALISAFSF